MSVFGAFKHESEESPEPSGPSRLRDLLAEYFAELSDLGVPVAKFLRTGLSESDVRSKLAELGLGAPAELVAWYTTFDGADFGTEEAPINCFPVYRPHSLDTALRLYSRESKVEGHGWEEWQWNPEWLRLAEPVNGLAVRCVEDDRQRVQVRAVGHDHTTNGPGLKYEVISLCTPVSWWIQGIREGIYTWNTSGQRWNAHDPRAFPMEIALTGLV